MTDAISAANALAAQSPATTPTSTGIAKDLNTFLKILTTQLQNQDPLAATDVNQFTQQLVQFSGVEQQINTNTKLDQLLNVSNNNGVSALLNYVGKYVEAPATDGKIALQDGKTALSYSLPATARSATITITDSTGQPVATLNGSTRMGKQTVTWDGTKTTGSSKAVDGIYNMRITAVDMAGNAMSVGNIKLVGKATGIETASNGTSMIYVGGIAVKASDINAVYLALPPAA